MSENREVIAKQYLHISNSGATFEKDYVHKAENLDNRVRYSDGSK